MQNSITLEVSAGIITFVGLVCFVTYQIVHFNKHLGDQLKQH